MRLSIDLSFVLYSILCGGFRKPDSVVVTFTHKQLACYPMLTIFLVINMFLEYYRSPVFSSECDILCPTVCSQQCQYYTAVEPSSRQWRNLSGQLHHHCDWIHCAGTDQPWAHSQHHCCV